MITTTLPIPLQVMETLEMSQESVLSTGSTHTGKHGAGTGGAHKRARKCSVIQDPIHLNSLHAVARENRRSSAAMQ